MDVKTFEGATMKEAVKAVRDEFGKEAVILETTERPFPDGNKIIITAAQATSKAKHGGTSSSKFETEMIDARFDILERKV